MDEQYAKMMIHELAMEYAENGEEEATEALGIAEKALTHQIEIEQAALIQAQRKCVLGRDEMYSDSTLQSMSKQDLIGLLHVAQHNYSVLLESYDRRMKYYEQTIDELVDDVNFAHDSLTLKR